MLKEERAKEILEKRAQNLNDLGIEFFLIYGTALGAYRDGKFIENDRDIDIGVKASQLEKLKQTHNKDILYFNGLTCSIRYPHYYYVDVSVFYPKGDKYYFIKGYDGKYKAKEFDREYFDKLDEIEFYGRTYKIPSNTEDYLEYLYGDWRTPAMTNNARPLVEVDLET